MTEQLILASKATHRYIQPHYEWAECITSHRISRKSFIDLMNCYKPTEQRIVTTYHNTDMIYVDTFYCYDKIRSATCYTLTRHEDETLDNLEYIGEDTFNLSINKFAPSLNYSHERQSLQLVSCNHSYSMILEILIPSIVNPTNLNTKAIIEQLLTDNIINIISLSYRFMIKKISQIELADQIANLKKLTHPFDCNIDLYTNNIDNEDETLDT